MLSTQQLNDFVDKGFVCIEGVVPRDLCSDIRDILWNDTGVDRHDPSTWTQPVIRLMDYQQPPFRMAANMPALHKAFDQLVGKDNWIPRGSLGTFPVRFPSDDDPGDTGWHVDASFPGDDPSDIFSWRINVHSKGRALLMLFLFSDVGERDAPTRIKTGSHLHVARLLAPFGEEGLSFAELSEKLASLPAMDEELATGEEGTVYLCHPFLAHAAQAHRGSSPRFLAQPPLALRQPYSLTKKSSTTSPVELAILNALGD